MIKINLLPKTINEKRVVRSLAILFGIIFVAIIVGGFGFTTNLGAKADDMEAQAAAAEQRKTEVEAIKTEATSARSRIEPVKKKTDFINDVLDYNVKMPRLYEEIAKWAYEKVEYRSFQFNGTNVVIQARVKTLDDLGRYLLNMYRATDLFSQVSIDGVPGYPMKSSSMLQAGDMYGYGEPAGYDLAGYGAIETGVARTKSPDWIEFTVNLTLKQPLNAPSIEGQAVQGSAQQQQAMPAGAPGAPGAMPAPGRMPLPEEPWVPPTQSGGAAR
ncbi:MAG: hypothetical protein A2Z18_03615 [Armatimonadetes bacterium RBG_16_58_9]|nr:MAG: hypothetical protein A2Z18_03615 [Armatimonadetes bacterium RBG_16_58_9]